jgi:hypothetical protein
MRSSTVPARIITALIGVVVTPIALGLLSSGGLIWYQTFTRYGGFDGTLLVGPTALQAAGIALQVVVVLTGLWSSAGLLAAGALSVFTLAFALFPSLTVWAYRLPVPHEWIDGASYGLPTALLPVLGSMGLALWFARHRPSRSAALHVIGVFATPVLLLVGAWLVALSLARSLDSMRRLELGPAPDALGLLLGGVVFIAAGFFFTRWSPYALLLPALFLIIITPLFVAPGSALFQVLFPIDRDAVFSLLGIVAMGTGVAAAVLYIANTLVLVRTRARAAQFPATVHPGFAGAEEGFRAGIATAGMHPGGAYPGGAHAGGAQYASASPENQPPAPPVTPANG